MIALFPRKESMVSSWAGLNLKASAVPTAHLYGLASIQPRIRDTPVPDSPDFYNKTKLKKNSCQLYEMSSSRKLEKFKVKCSKKCCCPQKCSELHLQYSEHFWLSLIRKDHKYHVLLLFIFSSISFYFSTLCLWFISNFNFLCVYSVFSCFSQNSTQGFMGFVQ